MSLVSSVPGCVPCASKLNWAWGVRKSRLVSASLSAHSLCWASFFLQFMAGLSSNDWRMNPSAKANEKNHSSLWSFGSHVPFLVGLTFISLAFIRWSRIGRDLNRRNRVFLTETMSGALQRRKADNRSPISVQTVACRGQWKRVGRRRSRVGCIYGEEEAHGSESEAVACGGSLALLATQFFFLALLASSPSHLRAFSASFLPFDPSTSFNTFLTHVFVLLYCCHLSK